MLDKNPPKFAEDKMNEIKHEVNELISDAKKSVKKIEEAVSNCDAFQLSFLIGDADEARGVAGVLAKIFPDDTDIRQMRKEAVDAHILAYKGRDKFTTECFCQRKI